MKRVEMKMKNKKREKNLINFFEKNGYANNSNLQKKFIFLTKNWNNSTSKNDHLFIIKELSELIAVYSEEHFIDEKFLEKNYKFVYFLFDFIKKYFYDFIILDVINYFLFLCSKEKNGLVLLKNNFFENFIQLLKIYNEKLKFENNFNFENFSFLNSFKNLILKKI